MSTEDGKVIEGEPQPMLPEGATPREIVRFHLLSEGAPASWREQWADTLLDRLEAEATQKAREAARTELESRFDPEARKLDRFVAGWLSAAEYLTADPLTGEAGS